MTLYEILPFIGPNFISIALTGVSFYINYPSHHQKTKIYLSLIASNLFISVDAVYRNVDGQVMSINFWHD